MKRKPQRKPNLTKYQLSCLARRVAKGERIPSGVGQSLCKKGYVSSTFYYNARGRHGRMIMVSDNLPTMKGRLLIMRLYNGRYRSLAWMFV